MTLNHFFVLHCHLSLRLPTFKTVSLRKPEKCALASEWKGRLYRLSTSVRRRSHLSTGWQPAGCVQVPLGGRRAGWRAEMAYWVMAHRHTSFWGSSCCCGLQGWEWLGGAPLRHMMHSRRGPCRALVNRGLSLVIHPGKPKALRWSQNIFGLSTNYHDYGSTFLSWNLKPKALSC